MLNAVRSSLRNNLAGSPKRAFSVTPLRSAIFSSVDVKTFESEVLNANKDKVVLVDFYADWCGPCKMLKPILTKVANNAEANCDLVTVDTEELTEVAQKYKIASLPTVVAFRKGKEVSRFIGARNEKAVLSFVNEIK
ncbi:Thioredoxin-like protein [Phaffia rhodozyma]|uniref:Thioredoxin-like protein n=1 Tax=Phaffia rhodozyma TaxID=264483 RepID=A0A0F7STV2_PHARH|nr:Thioredoxin-like protein [Phaffia rhodozyma]